MSHCKHQGILQYKVKTEKETQVWKQEFWNARHRPLVYGVLGSEAGRLHFKHETTISLEKKNCIYEIFHGQLMILNQYCTICLPMRNKYVSGFVDSLTIFSFETKSGLILDIQ